MNNKVLFVSPVIPPYPAGVSIILGRLLKYWPTEQYILAATAYSNQDLVSSEDYNSSCVYLTPDEAKTGGWRKGNKFWQKSKKIVLFPRRMYRLYKELEALVIDRGVTKIVYCTGDLLALPVCYLLSRKHSITLSIYVFDDYINQWPYPFLRGLIKYVESICLKYVDSIITTNEFLAFTYYDRYKKMPKVIHNGLEKGILPIGFSVDSSTLKPNKKLKLVYTGSIYYAHYDVFLSFIRFMKNTTHPVELHIYTSQDEKLLEKKGLVGADVYYHDYLPQAQISSVMQSADFLLLPLSFNKKYRKVIDTAAPCKMAEYLASGTQVLTIVPPSSFVSWYFKTHKCGIVVNELSETALQSAFDNVFASQEVLSETLSAAYSRVHTDFTYDSIQKKLAEALGIPGSLGS